MTKYRLRADVEVEVDRSTATQTVHTPWGIVAIRRGDMIVPMGPTITIPIPETLWLKWFEPVEAPPAPPRAMKIPDAPFNQWLRRDLEQYATEVLNEKKLPNFPRKSSLVQWIVERVGGTRPHADQVKG